MDMEYMVYIWLTAIVVFTVFEALTVQMITIWLAIAALFALILSLFGAPLWAQLAAFIVGALMLLIFTRPIVRRLMKEPTRTNADRTLGMPAIVVMEINNELATGQVQVNGQIWSARSQNGSILPLDERVIVQSIEGVKLIVSEYEPEGDETASEGESETNTAANDTAESTAEGSAETAEEAAHSGGNAETDDLPAGEDVPEGETTYEDTSSEETNNTGEEDV